MTIPPRGFQERMTKWHVRGLVAGPALPTETIQLSERCRISKISEQQKLNLIERAALRPPDPNLIASSFDYPDLYSAEMPLTTMVHSQHQLSIVVKARNPVLALAEAEKEASKHLAALGLAVGVQRYRFCPAVMNIIPGDGTLDMQDYITTGVGAVTIYENETLQTSAVDYAKALLRMAGKDKIVERAFGFLQAAWRLRDIPLDDPAIHKAVLSNCFLVLEAVSDAITKDWREQNKAENLSKQGEIVDDLTEKLDRTESVSKRVAAVREAHKMLQRTDLYFQDLKFEAAGRTLGVEERFVSLAKDLNKLRNRKLGHAGSATDQEINDWIYKPEDERLPNDPGHFGKGELTAMAYLKAYVTRIADT